jgi:hypothetical protein
LSPNPTLLAVDQSASVITGTVLEFSSTWKYFESVEENDILLLCVCSGVEVAESFTFDVLASNLTADLTGPPGQSNATAIEKVNARCGTASPLPLAADSVLARYLNIVVAFVIYIVASVSPLPILFVSKLILRNTLSLFFYREESFFRFVFFFLKKITFRLVYVDKTI